MYFAVITDKIRKKYIVVKTFYRIKSVFIQLDKEVYSQVFSDRYNDRLERIEYIKFCGYRFKYRLLFDFLK